jgi:hypothetical protein
MHLHAVFSSLHRGTQLAAAIDCGNSKHLAWVGVYPLDISRPLTREFLRNKGVPIVPATGRAYHVRIFEVDRKLVEADASIGEKELANARSIFAFDDKGLVDQLDRIGVPLERLELPYKCDYPI